MKYIYSTNWMGPAIPGYEGYACGRIDIRGGNLNYFGTEIGVPLIDEKSWNGITNMLDNFKTKELWSWVQIVNKYEKESKRKIQYWEANSKCNM